MAESATAPAAAPDRPLTLEEKKAAARARARAARQAEQAGEAFVTISPAAADYIREAAREQGRPEGVRLRILAGGCSGLEYKLDLLEAGETAGAGDREIASNGVMMLMDLKSAIHVTGSTIDYEQGLLRRGFRIKNPNATSTCSCGDSFGAA
ncbi:MAG TPA: iron-sulfur cluster assembly accessory protein [Miltoncostaeaceae bacterium]|jgi:iron-sulfur cluster assembly protein|nr:iron-sulfur cluster assembly accessory protein [Miltoncostaeaceae bacterium]